MKKGIIVVVVFAFNWANSQTQATLDSIATDYKACIARTADKVNCTKELYWVYQDVETQFYFKSTQKLDATTKHAKDIEEGKWVDSKYYHFSVAYLNFKKKHPKQEITKPTKDGENDAYLTFKSIAEYILLRIKELM